LLEPEIYQHRRLPTSAYSTVSRIQLERPLFHRRLAGVSFRHPAVVPVPGKGDVQILAALETVETSESAKTTPQKLERVDNSAEQSPSKETWPSFASYAAVAPCPESKECNQKNVPVKRRITNNECVFFQKERIKLEWIVEDRRLRECKGVIRIEMESRLDSRSCS
jgi:hypothetical protein